MSTPGGFAQGSGQVGEVVATHPAYEAAQKTVSRLIAGDVPARDIAIVGYGLRSVERVTGRLGYAAAARSGAINGLLLGLLFSAVFVIGTPSVPIQAFVGVMFLGIAVGMLLSLVLYALLRRRRDYASVTQVVADHYEVTVAPTSIHTARQVLAGASGSTATAGPAVVPPRPSTTPAEPPRYGERIPTTPSASEGGDASPAKDAESGSGAEGGTDSDGAPPKP